MNYRQFKNYYEGETTTPTTTITDDGDDDGGETATPTPTPIEKKEEKPPQQFTQEQVNKFLAEERRKLQKANENTVKQLEALRRNASLTEQEKINLEERIETIKNEFLTKEQIQQKEQKKEAIKKAEELQNAIKEGARWKTLYEESTVDNTLLGAAASDPDVFNPKQIHELLKPRTRLVEELDTDGKPTGRFTPRIKLPGKNKDGESIILELTATEAVKQMKENTAEFGNLFKSNVVKGVGGSNNGDARKGGGPPDDPAAFRVWRKANPDYAKNQ
jgi:hypothetical protein